MYLLKKIQFNYKKDYVWSIFFNNQEVDKQIDKFLNYIKIYIYNDPPPPPPQLFYISSEPQLIQTLHNSFLFPNNWVTSGSITWRVCV